MKYVTLEIPIENLPATSSITIRKLKSLGINTYFDLLNYFPYRYENYSIISSISKLQPEEIVTVNGKIIEAKNQYTRSGLKIQKVVLTDETGKIEVNWFNQPYLIRLFRIGDTVSVAGIVKRFGSKISIEPKEYEVSEKRIHTGRFVPIYSEKKGLSSRTIREKIFSVLHSVGNDPRVVPDVKVGGLLPPEIISYNNLIDVNQAYQQIHFPDNLNLANKARERLAFDELFTLQLANNLIKKEWQKERVGNIFKISNFKFLISNFITNLPFKLTGDQNKAVEEIIADLKKTVPMNRFLQGDVGSGKTVVAAIACYFSFLNGYQSLFMAPTEILANQHYQTISNLFKNYPIKIGLQTGSNKINILSTSRPWDRYNIVIGTQALISKKFNLDKVGLVVIDEQHRFGVNQRALLKKKALNPHLLTMTATPIPRTVALTLYGELNLSYIEEMPQGRLRVKTFLVPKEKRSDGYRWIKSQILNLKSQIFIVCPLIEESESETMKSVKAAKIEYENLRKIFSEFRLGLLHGKIKAKEKERIMTDFKSKKIDILVSTPVVEVGIDIPGATIMVIEGAERFGLAQLHQLRGRVGRSNVQSYCFVFTEKEDLGILGRLGFFAKTNNGNKLAEYDLKDRGAGNIFGTEQHGFVNLKIASLTDYELINKTKKAVEYFVGKYDIENWQELKKRLEKYEGKQINRD
ncbi:ATP-dependent DNA helicase RecG [Candidatus Roizmanbacteria bacterium]|nr:ATP-dependent DNA helicase RecG [Candidatus Roizmanbacteria bacterium]